MNNLKLIDWEVRAFRALTCLYPPEFRKAYGSEVVAFFLQERSQKVRGPSLLRVVRWWLFWMGTVLDLVVTGIRLRRREQTERGGWMGGWIGDLRHTIRVLLREPTFTLVALITVVLGVGSTAAIFSVVDGVVLRPLAYHDSERLVLVGALFDGRGDEPGPVSVGDFRQIRDRARTLEEVAYAGEFGDVLLGDGDPEAVTIGVASSRFFDVFDGAAALGRLFDRDDHAAAAIPVAVLDHGFWVRRFGADPSVLGQTLTLEEKPLVIIGVLSPEWRAPARLRGGDAVAWTQLTDDEDDGWFGLRSSMVGRMGEGEDVGSVDAEVARLGRLVGTEFRPDFPYEFRAMSLQELTVGSFAEIGRTLLLGAFLLLLIACANLANLSLTRRIDREEEMSLRAALGASHGRIVRLVVLENGVVALAGSALGLVLAYAVIEALKVVSPGGIPRLGEVGVDFRVAAFAGLAAIATALIAGLAPSLRTAEGADSLRRGGCRASGAPGVIRFRRAMVVAETGLALILLTSAGLLVRSFQELAVRDTGLAVNGLATLRVDVRRLMRGDEQVAFFDALEARVAALPGVDGASWISALPFTNDGVLHRITLERGTGDLEVGGFLSATSISRSFFETARLEIRQGRGFGDDDLERAPSVAIVNEAFVQQYWPDEPRVLGLLFWYGDRGEGNPVEVVGVVGDMAYHLNAAPLPQLFVPMAQAPWGRASLVVHTVGEPEAILDDLRSIARSVAPNLPLELSTLEALYREELVRPRFYALLIGSFATLAGLLALFGLYGTVSYSVQRRTRELGIRIALGASENALVGSVVREGFMDAMLGIVLGVAASLITTRFVAAYLFRVEPTDVTTFAVTATLLLAASLVAAWIPARGVARVDPYLSLNSEA